MNALSKVILVAGVIIVGLLIFVTCSNDKSSAPIPSATANWTVLVYAAGNNYMDSTLYGNSLCMGDIQELEKVGSSNDVQVIAMLSSLCTSGIARYYQIEHFEDSANVISSPVLETLGARNMADAITLKDFLLYGIRNFPAENYMLIIDGYGIGWLGSCWDQRNGGGSLMPVTDMANAIEQALLETRTPKFQVMAFYMPSMSMAEVAYEFRNCAYWLTASEMSWHMNNYLAPQGWLEPLITDPGTSGGVLAGNFARAVFDAEQNQTASAHIASIDLSKISQIANLASRLGDSLSNYSGPYWNEILDARNQSHHQDLGQNAYVDLLEFAVKLNESPHLHNLNFVNAYYDSLNNAFADDIPINLITTGNQSRGGLTIHLPNDRASYDSTDYAQLDFHNLGWNHFVSEFINMSEGLGRSSTISGVVSWPDHQLTRHTVVFLDTISSPQAYRYESTLVNPVNGNFSITINLMDSITIMFEGWDDVDSNGVMDVGDGWHFWDQDGDGNWNYSLDAITIHPGQDVMGIDIQLASLYKAR